MANWIKRPPARSRDAATRRAAVNEAALESLGADLTEFARNDPDAGVRIAALERAADMRLARERMQDDDAAAVREAATALYRSLLVGQHAKAPPLAEREQLLAACQDAQLIEHVACQGREPRLREAALRKLARPALTRQRLLHDPDPDLRLRLLDQVQDVEHLRRIIEATRRRDKALHQHARQRLQDLQVAAGDRSAIQAAALALCTQLEARPSGPALAALLAASATRWQALEAGVDETLRRRYHHAHAQCLSMAGAQHAPAAEPAADETWVASKLPRMDEPEHASAPVPPAQLAARQLAAEVRFQASVQASRSDPAERSPPPAPPAPGPDLGSHIKALSQALEAGQLAAAEPHLRLLQGHASNMPRQHRRAWQRARARYHELQRWEGWSTRRQRRQLCVDARALRGSTLHPEAIANRVQELRKAWQKLDQLEPASVRQSAGNRAIEARFQGLCQRALAPTRAWFQERDQARAQQVAATEQLLQTQLPDDDFRAMARLRRQLVEARHQLHKATPAARQSLATRISAAISRLDEPLQAHHDTLQARRAGLIKQAQALGERPVAERVPAARDLQERWQALGPGRRRDDQRQWRVFRQAIDAVFAERDAWQQAQREAQVAARASATQLIDEVRTAADSDDDAGSRQALLQSARSRWQTLDLRDGGLRKRFAEACQALEQGIDRAQADAVQQRYRAWIAALAEGQLPTDAPRTWRDSLGQDAKLAPHDPAVAAVLVDLEILAGCDSPPQDADLRMQRKLQRLQASMAGGADAPIRERMEAAVAAWIALGPAVRADAACAERFSRACDSLLPLLSPAARRSGKRRL